MTPALNAPASAADPLAGLRAYHLPEPVSWWPPAPGWWLLVLSVLALIALLAWWMLRRRRRQAAARQAVRELNQLRAGLAIQDDKSRFVRELSKLLRRFAIAVFPRREVASLAGEDWLRFLDRHGGDGRFTEGPGRQLALAPYRPRADVAPEALAALAEDWIRRNREIRR
jgi:hypothetical protein